MDYLEEFGDSGARYTTPVRRFQIEEAGSNWLTEEPAEVSFPEEPSDWDFYTYVP